MGSTTSRIMRQRRRNKMSDAGGAEGAEQDLDFELDESFAPRTDIAEEMREGAFSYRSDPMTGELTGGPADREAGGGTPVVAPEIGIEGGEPQPKKEEPLKVEEPEKPPEKKRPVITRARRRRSILTEEEGGVLRKPTVYRRSILGR